MTPSPRPLPTSTGKSYPVAQKGLMAAPESDMVEGLEAPRDDDDAPVCCICHEAPRGVVLLACGHSILCVGCFNSLSSQPGDRAACPLCRAKLAPLALPMPSGEVAAFMPTKARLELLRPMLAGLLHGESNAPADAIVAAGAPSDERARCLATLAAFASYSGEQCWMAHANRFLLVACTVLADSPLDAEVQAAAIALVSVLSSVSCGEVDEETGQACMCTPQALCDKMEELSAFQLAVVQPLLGFAGGTGDASRKVVSAACTAAQIMLSRRNMVPKRSRKSLTALARTLVRPVLPTLSDGVLHADAADGDECEKTLEVALEVLWLLWKRNVRAAGTPEVAAAAARALDATAQRLFDRRSQEASATHAAMYCLSTLINDEPDREAAAACAHAAAESGASRPLLRYCLMRCSCICPNCAKVIAEVVMPLLKAVLATSPAALHAALDDETDLISTLSTVSVDFRSFNEVMTAVSGLAAAVMTPPSNDGHAEQRRAACARAANQFVKGSFLHHTIKHIAKCPTLIAVGSVTVNTPDGLHLSRAAHALLTLSALVQHHGDVFAQWLDVEEYFPYVVMECVVKPVHKLELKLPVPQQQFPPAMCHQLSKVRAAASTVLAALLQQEHTAEATVATAEYCAISLRVLQRPLSASDPICGCAGCAATAGDACINLVRFVLAGESFLLRQVCERGGVGDMMRAALAQPWQPALRRNAPTALALIMALLAAGCADGREEEENPEQP